MPENITMPVGGTVNRTSHAQVKKQREETFVQKRKKKKKLFPRQKAVQDRYACIEGLTKMHMDHAMPIAAESCTFGSASGSPQAIRTGAWVGIPR